MAAYTGLKPGVNAKKAIQVSPKKPKSVREAVSFPYRVCSFTF
jgi:hypothetical protein